MCPLFIEKKKEGKKGSGDNDNTLAEDEREQAMSALLPSVFGTEASTFVVGLKPQPLDGGERYPGKYADLPLWVRRD